MFLAQAQGVSICLHPQEQDEFLAQEARIECQTRPLCEDGACEAGLACCHRLGMRAPISRSAVQKARSCAESETVFGDYISVYGIQRSVEDKATVPIYYESRLGKLALEEKEKPNIDPEFEKVTEGEEAERKEKLKNKWAQIEVVVGAERRLKLVAQAPLSE